MQIAQLVVPSLPYQLDSTTASAMSPQSYMPKVMDSEIKINF
jgi:hypothetical protein